MKTTNNNKKGFTLVEIILVVAIITILAGVALFNIGASISRYKNYAERLSIRNGEYGLFEPQGQFEASNRLSFSQFISEYRANGGNIADLVVPHSSSDSSESSSGGSSSSGGGSSSSSDSSSSSSSSASSSSTSSVSSGGGSSSSTTGGGETPSGNTGAGSNGSVSWGNTVSAGSSGHGNGTRGVISVASNGDNTTFYMTQNNGWNASNVTITENSNGSYTINLGSSSMRDSFINDGCQGMNWSETSYTITPEISSYLNSHYGINVGSSTSGGGTTPTPEITETPDVTPAPDVNHLSAGDTTRDGVYTVVSTSGNSYNLRQTNNSGNTVQFTLSANADGTYHLTITGGNKYIFDDNTSRMFANNGVQFWSGNDFDLNPTLTSYFRDTLGIVVE